MLKVELPGVDPSSRPRRNEKNRWVSWRAEAILKMTGSPYGEGIAAIPGKPSPSIPLIPIWASVTFANTSARAIRGP